MEEERKEDTLTLEKREFFPRQTVMSAVFLGCTLNPSADCVPKAREPRYFLHTDEFGTDLERTVLPDLPGRW
jgi:hypothetical protein